jgi:hypothetical protein
MDMQIYKEQEFLLMNLLTPIIFNNVDAFVVPEPSNCVVLIRMNGVIKG